MMEDYTANLEQLVKERTQLLEEAQQQADRLLKNMLPSSIADDLKAGGPVPPQLYTNATVLFSDIRGFSRMAANSTPYQVRIRRNHCQKRRIQSGDDRPHLHGRLGSAPRECQGHRSQNANRWSNWLSQRIRGGGRCEFFGAGEVKALPGGRSDWRPRAAVCSATPSTRSRMESTGMDKKSKSVSLSYNLIKCFYPQFIVIERGKVEIKGKGECNTFFL
ncbi:hypothetical protein niasHT_003774 [Heterodera trifolii]|uniref:Guanylate cyclase domain-containing protein n=1 Tax=Heterodera trifolii TaxID=157864 RepID=A0ABD2LV34_9BILA